MHKVRLLSQLIFSMLVVFFALLVLITSVFRSAQIRYSFEPVPTQKPEVLGDESLVDYQLPYPGRVEPDSPVWPLKVARDKVWLGITTNPLKGAEISLLFADKRMASARESFTSEDWDQGVATAQKAQRYLSLSLDYAVAAGDENMDTSKFLLQLANASLKHREILEDFFNQTPSDAIPLMSFMIDNCKEVYSKSAQELNERGVVPPANPFNKP